MAPIIGTAGSREKRRLVENLGASRCVDYTSEDFRETVTEITKGRGVDWCLESVGGEVYERSLESLGPTGRLVLIGLLPGWVVRILTTQKVKCLICG
mgnify:CR=1 FL=1